MLPSSKKMARSSSLAKTSLHKLVSLVTSQLTDELRRPPWRGAKNPLAGHCYVACEAIYHLSGRKLRPHFIRVNGGPHWFLRDAKGEVCDPTASQFTGGPVDYSQGRGKGFLTVKPSARCQVILDRCKILRGADRRADH